MYYRANVYDKIRLNYNTSLLTTFHYHSVSEESEKGTLERCATIMLP